MNIINVDIMSKVGNEEFWTFEGSRTEYSHHMYNNSPFESSDSCNNCNGAMCKYCREVTIPARLVFATYSDTLYKWVVEAGVPEDVASELVYSDYCRYSYKGYHLVCPTESMLKEQYPDLYDTIITTDQEVLDVIHSYIGKYKAFGDLQRAVLDHYGLDKYTWNGHVYNQLELYWISCNYDHSEACS